MATVRSSVGGIAGLIQTEVAHPGQVDVGESRSDRLVEYATGWIVLDHLDVLPYRTEGEIFPWDTEREFVDHLGLKFGGSRL